MKKKKKEQPYKLCECSLSMDAIYSLIEMWPQTCCPFFKLHA